jgi:hypothetical protein
MDGVLKYNNGVLYKDTEGYTHLDIPFKQNTPCSVVTTEDGQKFGNVLYYAQPETSEDGGNIFRFKYVIGGRLNEDGSYTVPIDALENNGELIGLFYDEAYIFSEKETREFINDELLKIKYKQINYDLNVDNGSTGVILSTVTYNPHSVWNIDGAMTAPLLRKDYLIGLSEYPTEDVNITIDRGLSHSFEKHLMLCETNTFNDLKNYKNNYFNLQ